MTITCPVCQTVNHHLATICVACRGFIQPKVDNLDLFSTMWEIIESPRKGFRKVALSRNKNYIFILFAIGGIAFMFVIFWLLKVGEITDSLLNIMAAGVGVGPFLGIILMLLFALILKVISGFYRTQVSFRNILATTAYAIVPIVFSAVIVLPLELMTFGIYFFIKSPGPSALNPVPYFILMGLDGLCSLWSLILLWVGLKVLLDTSWMKSVIIVFLSLSVFLTIIYVSLLKIAPTFRLL